MLSLHHLHLPTGDHLLAVAEALAAIIVQGPLIIKQLAVVMVAIETVVVMAQVMTVVVIK